MKKIVLVATLQDEKKTEGHELDEDTHTREPGDEGEKAEPHREKIKGIQAKKKETVLFTSIVRQLQDYARYKLFLSKFIYVSF